MDKAAGKRAVNQKVFPMEPLAAEKLPQGPGFIFQVKWDGIRVLAHVERGEVVLRGRRLKDLKAYYGELKSLPLLAGNKSCILDGELIALNNGRPCFSTLMKRAQSRPENPAHGINIPVYYMVFDLLFLEGSWLLAAPWEKRQHMLRQTLQEAESVFITPSSGEGEELLKNVEERKMEGVVAKDSKSPYVPGPKKSGYWLKIKVNQKIKALVGGIFLKNGRPQSLLLGIRENNTEKTGAKRNLRFIGSVSSGLKEEELRSWLEYGRACAVTAPPFLNPPQLSGREALWLEPSQEIDVTYNEWTPGLKLRSPRVETQHSRFAGN